MFHSFQRLKLGETLQKGKFSEAHPILCVRAFSLKIC